MKKHLFYTFLVIFVVTTFVTLLGVVGAIHIAEGYLTPLVIAFLVELAGAVVAIFKSATFFDDDGAELLRVKGEHAQVLAQLDERSSRIESLEKEIGRLQQANRECERRLTEVSSLRLRILSILGSSSVDRASLLRELNLERGTPQGNLALDAIGKLVDGQEIEQDPQMPTGYYRLRKK